MRAFAITIFAVTAIRVAHAQPQLPPPQAAVDPAPPPSSYAAPLPPPPPNTDAAHMDGARFSGKRFVVEILAGGALGSLVAYGTYSSLCGRGDCTGAALAGFGMNFAVTPLAVWGVGRAMGGEGTLGWTYLGASTALAPFSVSGPADESTSDMIARIDLEFAMSALFLPITSSLFYELSSHLHYKQWRASQPAGFAIAPVYGEHHHVTGALGQVSLSW
jgi:hypothetical protein